MFGLTLLFTLLASTSTQERRSLLPNPEERAARVYESYLHSARSLPRGTITVQVAASDGDVPETEDVERLTTTSHAEPTGVFDMAHIRERRHGGCGFSLDRPHLFERVERDGRFVFEARFENVPELEHRIFAISDRLVQQRVQTVRPGETVRFVYQHVEPDHAYGFRVRLGPRGPLDERYLIWPAWCDWGALPDDFPLSQQPVAGGVHRYRLPDRPLEWCLYRRDYQRAYGDRDSFLPAPPPDRGFWAEVELTPGFAVRMRTVDEAGTPVRWVRVQFDGKVFTTDGAGLALLATDDPEPTTRIDLGGFEIVGGNVEKDGTFDRYSHGLDVVLR